MKQKMPDQAEKLRQLAAKEMAEPNQSTAATLEAEKEKDSSTSVERSISVPPLDKDKSYTDKPNTLPQKHEEKNRSQGNGKKEKRKNKGKEENVSPNPSQQTVKQASSSVEVISPPTKPEPPSVVGESGENVTQLVSSRFPVDGHTRVIAITGGKGGVGKTNVACNLGIAMAQMRKNVLLLDADLSLANVDILLGLTPRLNLSHVIAGEKKLSEVMIEGPSGLRIVPGGSGLEEFCQLSVQEMNRIFEAFAEIHPVPDILLVDTAAGIHPNVLQFLLASNQVLVVTTPEPPAYTDAYALIKTLVRHDPKKEIGVLINMANDSRESNEVIRLMLQICRQMLHVGFNNIGTIPRDANVLKAVRHQQPFIINAPNSPAAKSIRHIAGTVLQIGCQNGAPRGLKGFFKRLFTPSSSQAAAIS